MRKISKLLLALATVALYTACTSEIDDVFDESPANRIDKALVADKQVLTSAQNGWLMEYYGNTDYGGYTVFCKFNDDNTVTVASEIYDSEKTVKSHYKLEQSQGVVLSFDEYNLIMHSFSDPDPTATLLRKGSTGKGFEGDFEFRIIKCTTDSVVMTGKKHGSRIVMTPFSGNWQEYIEKVWQSEDDMAFGSYIMVVGQDTANVKTSERTLSVSYTDSVGALQTVKVPFIQCPGSYKFYKPLELFGTSVTSVSYDNNEEFTFKANDNRLLMKGVVYPINKQFIEGLWFTSFSNLGSFGQNYWNFCNTNVMPIINGVYPGTLDYFYFGEEDGDFGLFYLIIGYWGINGFDYELVGDDEVTLVYNSAMNQYNASTFMGSGFLNVAAYLTAPLGCDQSANPVARTFKITCDNLKSPTEVLLTDVDNPENTIRMYAEEIYGDLFNK